MRNRMASGSGLFLIELMIGIMIFAIAAAVCLKIFVTADQTAMESRELNRAVITAQNSAEIFKAAGGDLEETARLHGEGFTGDNVFTLLTTDYIVEITKDSIRRNGLIEGTVTVSALSGYLIFEIPISVLEVAP